MSRRNCSGRIRSFPREPRGILSSGAPMTDVERLVAYIRRTLTDLNAPPSDAA